MKKILALLLALLMLVSLCACGGGAPSSEGFGGKNPAVSQDQPGGEDLEQSMEDLEDALEILEYLKPEGWDENDFGAYIYDVWDESQLPDILPGPVEGMKPYQTFYKDYKHEDLQDDYSVGLLNYEAHDDYRAYGVSFYATFEQLEEYLSALRDKGFTGGTREEYDDVWLEYHFSDSGNWYIYIFFNTNDDEDGAFDGCATVYATDSVWDYPDSVAGTSLPRAGAPAYDYNSEFWVETYQHESGDMPTLNFDLKSDPFPESETQSWWMWFAYYGTVAAQAKAHVQQMLSEGWELQWESEDGENYWSALQKDGVYAVVNCFDGYELQVGFSDMIENLSY